MWIASDQVLGVLGLCVCLSFSLSLFLIKMNKWRVRMPLDVSVCAYLRVRIMPCITNLLKHSMQQFTLSDQRRRLVTACASCCLLIAGVQLSVSRGPR